MDKCRHLWVLAVALGLVGCADEQQPVSSQPAAGPAAGAPAKAPAAKTCTPAAPAPTPAESKKSEAPPLEPPKTGDAKEQVKPTALTDAQIAKIRKLPAAEQEVAIKQGVCPISGQHLGSMGMPYKITAEGRTFYLCCEGCEEKVTKDPKAAIAALDKK